MAVKAVAKPATPTANQGKIPAFGWKWQNDSKPWGCEARFARIRLEPGAEPTRFISCQRKEAEGGLSRVYDIKEKKVIATLVPSGPNADERFFDADFIEDTLVTVGGNGNSCVNVFNIKSKTHNGFYLP